MKKIFTIIILVHFCTFLFAQNDTITSRDTISMGFLIKKVLIPDYETLLNMISDKSYSQNEIEDIIKNKTKGAVESRIFVNDSVIIDSDLKPGADTNKLLRGEKNVVDYLNTFYTNYTRSDVKTVSLNIVQISALKKKNYFYQNVLFECDYASTDISGKPFSKFNRVAEIKFIYDKEWRSYISAIRFPDSTDMGLTDVYKKIKITDTDVDKLFRYYEEEKEKKNVEEKNRINALITEGDILIDAEKYDESLNKYLEAQRINFADKDAKAAVKKARESIADEKKKKKINEERNAHIEEMKKNAVREKDNYNFHLAKSLCDSLLKEYSVNDTKIEDLSNQMSKLIASLSGIETAMDNKDTKDVRRKCESKIKESQLKNDLVSQAEFEFRLALSYIILESTEVKEIFLHLNNAITLSQEHHQEALIQRAKMNIKTGKISDAVEDATRIVNNDPRNAENYIFRALLYEQNRNHEKAIDDYRQAINLKTNDSTAYEKKSRLELMTGKYNDSRKTASDGIVKTICYGLLSFNRGLANDKLSDHKTAGDDFRQAVFCGISERERTAIQQISETYVRDGNMYYGKSALYDARNVFTKSILIDSSLNGLYGRARTYIKLGANDSAITDLDKLIRRKPDYLDAHSQRGIAYANMKKFTEANADFEDETKRFPDNAPSLYAKGICELAQKKWANAAISFDRSGAILFSDSVFYYSSLAYFNNKEYDKAIAASNKARENDTKLFQVYYISGRAYYMLLRYKDAIKEYETAIGYAPKNEELIFWYAVALEANEKYSGASQVYDKLYASSQYKDTASFRSGVCMIKTGDEAAYSHAIKKLNQYLLTPSITDKSEVYAWIAYCYLKMDSLKKADEYIENAKKENDKNPRLQFVMACANAQSSRFDESVIALEEAMKSKIFTSADFDDERLLKPVKKNISAKYDRLMQKYFRY